MIIDDKCRIVVYLFQTKKEIMNKEGCSLSPYIFVDFQPSENPPKLCILHFEFLIV